MSPRGSVDVDKDLHKVNLAEKGVAIDPHPVVHSVEEEANRHDRAVKEESGGSEMDDCDIRRIRSRAPSPESVKADVGVRRDPRLGLHFVLENVG